MKGALHAAVTTLAETAVGGAGGVPHVFGTIHLVKHVVDFLNCLRIGAHGRTDHPSPFCTSHIGPSTLMYTQFSAVKGALHAAVSTLAETAVGSASSAAVNTPAAAAAAATEDHTLQLADLLTICLGYTGVL